MMKEKIFRPKILIVEDEFVVALDMSMGLKRLGYDVLQVVSTGEEAISKTLELKPHLILMDIQLKGSLDGIQAAEVIRKSTNTPIIFLTAFADENTIERAKAAGPYGYLLKPYEETELHTAIEIVLQKHKNIEEVEASYVKELVLSEERFRLFINSVYDYAIFMIDTSGYIISWNLGAQRITGYETEEAIGKHYSLFFSDEEILQNVPALRLASVAQDGQLLEEGWRFKKDGEQFWAHVTLSALYDKNKNLIGFGNVLHDMTKTKIAEEILKNTVKARDEFISIASHELKTPLTSLLLQTQSFQRGQRRQDDRIYERERVNKIVGQTYKQVIRLSRLVEDMLDISRIRTGKFVLKLGFFDINSLLKEIIEKLSEQFFEARCDIPTFYPLENALVEWDKDRIEQVITNLLTNAIRYAPGRPINISIREEEKNIVIRVQDKGIGISQEDQERIFDRFERAADSNKVTGMGLGLFISKEIVLAHQGKIWVESKLHEGATFIVVIPRKLINQKEKVEASLNL